MVSMENAMPQLEEAIANAKTAAAAADVEPLYNAARKAAALGRQAATRAGLPVAIKVNRLAAGVRITVTGRGADRIQALMGQQLDALLPGASDQVKADIIRKGQP